MDREMIAKEFYIEDHAVIYGLLVKNAVETAGEAGMDSSVKGTILYGKERGLRMAMRAVADGEELTPNNYLVYGEWADPRNLGKSEIRSITPEYRTDSVICGWCEAWKKRGLLEFGKVYCTWIDRNLVKGFNPENELEINGTLSNGDPCCGFHWVGAVYSDAGDLKKSFEKKEALAHRVLKDFLYHTGHLLSAMCRQYYVDLGLVTGRAIAEKALRQYGDEFGTAKLEALVQEAEQDFLKV